MSDVLAWPQAKPKSKYSSGFVSKAEVDHCSKTAYAPVFLCDSPQSIHYEKECHHSDKTNQAFNRIILPDTQTHEWFQYVHTLKRNSSNFYLINEKAIDKRANIWPMKMTEINYERKVCSKAITVGQ